MSVKSAPDFIKNTQVIQRGGNVKTKSGLIKKNRYVILCRDSELGPACLVKYESLKDAKKSVIKSMHYLSSIENVARSLDDSCAVTIIFNDDTHLEFICKSAEEADQWAIDIKFVKQSEKIEECSYGNVNFMVMMSPCNVTNGQTWKCELMLTKEGLSIKELKSKEKLIIAQWPLGVIRSYKLEEKTTLAIDVGRKASTGAGTYRFSSNQADQIVKSMHRLLSFLGSQPTRTISQERPIYQYVYDPPLGDYTPLTNRLLENTNDPSQPTRKISQEKSPFQKTLEQPHSDYEPLRKRSHEKQTEQSHQLRGAENIDFDTPPDGTYLMPTFNEDPDYD